MKQTFLYFQHGSIKCITQHKLIWSHTQVMIIYQWFHSKQNHLQHKYMYSHICTTYRQSDDTASIFFKDKHKLHSWKQCTGVSSSFRHNLQEAYWLRHQYLRTFWIKLSVWAAQVLVCKFKLLVRSALFCVTCTLAPCVLFPTIKTRTIKNV